MSVSSNGVWPLADTLPSLPARFGPDCLVVVEVVGQMILNEIFARHTQVYRVPVAEFLPQLPGEESFKPFLTHMHTHAIATVRVFFSLQQ